MHYLSTPAYTTTVIDQSGLVEPVTLDEAKTQLRIDSTFEDTYITSLISVARDRSENFCNRYFSEQSIAINYEFSFPSGDIYLPFPDLQSIISVTYTDTSDVVQTVPSGDYTFNSERRALINSGSWPSDAKAVRIEVLTGVPIELGNVYQAMLMMITDLYELRVENVVGQTVSINKAVKAMLWPYRNNLGI